jgi:hypothetical protein
MKLYTADAIKDQVHKLLCKDCEETDNCSICDYQELIDEILNAPTVDPIKHGRWIHKYGDGHIEIATLGGECSECGFINTVTPYCPNCGAKMDEALQWEEPEIYPCRGCEDYDSQGGCLSKGGCGERREDAK